MFQTSQWVQVRPGASGSSTIKARLFAPAGTFSMRRGGLTLESSQVYFFGIFPPSANALLVTLSELRAGAFCARARLAAGSESATRRSNRVVFIAECCH